MRSGYRMQVPSWQLAFCLAIGLGGVAAPAAAAETTAAEFSRRLPHRPLSISSNLATASVPEDAELPITSAVRADLVAVGSSVGDVHQVQFTEPSAPGESIMTPRELIPPPSAPQSPEIQGLAVPGESTESIWEPSDTVFDDGAQACCDGGPVCWPGIQLNHLSLFGGLQASKNSSTRGEDGSFGFHQGINFGTASRNLILPPSMGLQIGFQATQSNIEGASFTNDDRKQYFFTAGAFRRSDHGLQGGLVFDHLWDEWYYELEAGQLRGELSLAISPVSSFGLWFVNSVTEEEVTGRVSGVDVVETWETVDYYTIFYRTGLFAGGRGEGQMMAGLTDDSDGIIGGKARMPLINGWAMETEFTYLVPDESRGSGANENEAWNLGFSLVWYPGTLSCDSCAGNHRPMFDVANNGSLILRRIP